MLLSASAAARCGVISSGNAKDALQLRLRVGSFASPAITKHLCRHIHHLQAAKHVITDVLLQEPT